MEFNTGDPDMSSNITHLFTVRDGRYFLGEHEVGADVAQISVALNSLSPTAFERARRDIEAFACGRISAEQLAWRARQRPRT
ncbi:MAG: hypothetical protein AB7R40_25445 [Nitrospiraceae bacterium]